MLAFRDESRNLLWSGHNCWVISKSYKALWGVGQEGSQLDSWLSPPLQEVGIGIRYGVVINGWENIREGEDIAGVV